MAPSKQKLEAHSDAMQRWQEMMVTPGTDNTDNRLLSPSLDSFALTGDLDVSFLATKVLDTSAFVTQTPSAAKAAEAPTDPSNPIKRKRGRPPIDKSEKERKKKEKEEKEKVQKDGSDSTGEKKDPKRRVTHNVIERRYRNNLNARIAELRSVVPSLNVPGSDGGKKKAGETAVAENDEDGSEDEQGNPSGGRLNKGTILMKATEYIQELESRLRTMDAFKARVVERFGADGDILVKEFFANVPESPQTTTPLPPAQKRQKVADTQKANEVADLAGNLGAGIALMQQQQQQIQQWLAIQQQYQVAAAVAASASVEAAFKSLSHSSVSPPPTTPSATLSPTRSATEKISPPILSPDNAFEGLGFPMGLTAMDLANAQHPGLIGSGSDMLLDTADFQSTESANNASMFNYLFDFGNDDISADFSSSGSSSNSGIRLLAMMFMSASVLYAPSPFDVNGGASSLHDHVTGRMLGRRSPSGTNEDSKLILSGIELSGMIGVLAAASWWTVKFVVLLIALSQVALALRRISYTKKRSAQTVTKQQESNLSSHVDALIQLQQLTASSMISYGASMDASVAGCSIEVLRFVACYLLGLGYAVDMVLTIGRRDKVLQWHALVAKKGVQTLDSLADGSSVEMLQIFRITLLTLSHASMAGSALSPLEICKIKLSAALALRLSIHKEQVSTTYTRIITSLSGWLWSDAITSIQDVLANFDRATVDHHVQNRLLPRWLAESFVSNKSNSFWTREIINEVFETDDWIVPSSTTKTLLEKFFQSQLESQLLDIFHSSSSSIVSCPNKSPVSAQSFETTQKLIHIFQDAQSLEFSAAFVSSSLAIMSCWRQQIATPASLNSQWLQLLELGNGLQSSSSLSKKIASVSMFITAMVKAQRYELAMESVYRLEDLLLCKDSVTCEERSIFCVEFTALSWVLSTLEGVDGVDVLKLKAVARMRKILPQLVSKIYGGGSKHRANDHLQCVVGWMNAV
ncbi:hypothetical protein BDR26DRAFT_914873 [Obelidium mucronatum]|nr:hypothetical protein BDR26DRAFT_914873 [Obelidium mucronatum]